VPRHHQLIGRSHVLAEPCEITGGERRRPSQNLNVFDECCGPSANRREHEGCAVRKVSLVLIELFRRESTDEPAGHEGDRDRAGDASREQRKPSGSDGSKDLRRRMWEDPQDQGRILA